VALNLLKNAMRGGASEFAFTLAGIAG